MSAVLDRLADWKRRCLYSLVQIRIGFVALGLRDYRSFFRILTGSAPGFTDPTNLTKWTRIFLYAHVAFVVIRLCLQALERGGGSIELWPTATVIWMALQILVVYGTFVLVPVWTHRANHNARQLGACDMTFTPAWAAGWYFVPPGLLWKPFQVMKEVWQASTNPTDWRGRRGSPLLGWWWALWLTTTWGELLVYGVATLALEPNEAQNVDNAIGLAVRLLQFPLTLLLLSIIIKVHRMQMGHHDAPRHPAVAETSAPAEGFADLRA